MARPLIVTGAGGRIGRLLRFLWTDPAIWLTRTEWDILGPPPHLPQNAVILDLSGVTHGDVQQNPRLANALALAALGLGAPVIYASSASVYPGGSVDMTETTPLAPASAYGQSKWAAETALRRHLPDAVILRIGNIAGADAILGPRAAGHAIVLDPVPDGARGPVRSYIGPQVLAQALSALCQTACRDQSLPLVMNLCQPGPVAMADLLDGAGLCWGFGPPRAAVLPRVALCTAQQSRHLTLPMATAGSLVTDLRALAGRWP